MNYVKWNFVIFELIALLQLSQAVLNFHDENFFNHTADMYDWSRHPCRRNCTKDNTPQICKYVFVVEQFLAMSKACYNCPFNVTDCFRPHCIPIDGVEKAIYVVNRQIPGPLIEVCENDTIEVDVRNRMLSESTTIHWHGFKQYGTPYMDGVPYVSQCPILPGESFRYVFKASVPGTFFYHSHIGNQRADGIFGPAIVKKPIQDDRMSGLYEDDSIHIMLNDWTHKPADEDFRIQYYDQLVIPKNIIVNGLGRYKKFNTDDGRVLYTPLSVLEVTSEVRYRIRVIDAGYDDCPIKMTIDNHTMLVIAMDSNDIEPVEVDAITIWPGERIDVVLNANQPPDNYWISFSGYSACNVYNPTNGVHQVAILRYTGVAPDDPKGPVGFTLPFIDGQRVLNPYNLGSEVNSSRNVVISDLNALAQNDISLHEHVDDQVYISFNFYDIDNYDFHRKGLYGYDQVPTVHRFGTLQFNHISLKMPSVPLMSQWDMVDPDSFCNATHPPKHKNCMSKSDQCTCTHVIRLRRNSVVELVFVAEGPGDEFVATHPLHLHGHFFRVVAMENLGNNVTLDQVKQLDREGKIKRKLDHAPLKDTIKTPIGGYTIVRLIANNPGYWLFHCHFETHQNIGMALIFKMGEHEDFPPKPKKFPQCGNYVPMDRYSAMPKTTSSPLLHFLKSIF